MKTPQITTGFIDLTTTGNVLLGKCNGCQIAAVQITTNDSTGATGVIINVEVSIDEKVWVEPRRSSDGGTGYFNSTVYGSNVTAMLYSIDVTGFNYIRVRNSGSSSTTGTLYVAIVAEPYSKTNATARTQSVQPFTMYGNTTAIPTDTTFKWFTGNWDRCLIQTYPANYTSGTLDLSVEVSLDGSYWSDACSIFDVYPTTPSASPISTSTDPVVYPLVSCICAQYLRVRAYRPGFAYTTAVFDCTITPILTSKEP